MENHDLSQAELDEIDSYRDPESDVQDKFVWSKDVQRQITALILADKHFMVESLSVVRPEFFEDDAHRLACEISQEYYKTYSELPGKAVLLDEVNERLSHRDSSVRVRSIAEIAASFDSYVDGVRDRDYYIEKLVKFAQHQAIKVAISKAVKLTKRGTDAKVCEQIQNLFSEALSTNRSFEVGLDYFNEIDERFQRADEIIENQEYFTSGFRSIDNALKHGGLIKKEFYAWVANSGVGKSNMLVTTAVKNITKFGKRVLYISLELDEDNVAERFDAQFTNIGINELGDNREKIKDFLSNQVKGSADTRMLMIKRFPSASLDVDTLRAFIQQLKFMGFVPDMVCLDYVGEMKDIPGIPTHESKIAICRNLRRLAIEEDFCLVSAMQPKVDVQSIIGANASGPGVIEEEHLADSKGQIRILDGAWSINRQSLESNVHICRIYVMKHRNGKTKFILYGRHDPETLMLSEISRAEYESLYRQAVDNQQSRATDTGVYQSDLNSAGSSGYRTNFRN